MSDLRNRIRLVGDTGTAPTLRYDHTGSPVTSFRLAVDNSSREQENAKPTWYTVELWGRNAERACELITKGANVTVEGRHKFDEWTDRDGKQRYSNIVANADFIIHKDGARNGEREPPA